jgi:hypothetical protein
MNGFPIRCLVIVALVLMAGCRTETETAGDGGESGVQAARLAGSSQHIVGVWAGVGVVDQQLLADKLVTLSGEEQEQLKAAASAFCSTVVAIEFRAEGAWEMDIEMKAVDGEILRDATVGSWRVVDQSENVVLVETTEPQPDGTTTQQRWHCEFVGDFDHLAIPTPLNSALVDCKPAFAFERLDAKSMTELRTAERAEKQKYW